MESNVASLLWDPGGAAEATALLTGEDTGRLAQQKPERCGGGGRARHAAGGRRLAAVAVDPASLHWCGGYPDYPCEKENGFAPRSLTGRHATNWEELPRGGPPLIWDDLIQFISVETGRRGSALRQLWMFGGKWMERGFAAYHPAVNFLFFAGAILLGMFFMHPACLLLSLLWSLSYYTFYRRAGRVRASSFRRFAFLHDFLLNPVFNTRGDTVLFTCFGGRPYTLEALGYGLSTGSMFLTVVLWFSCYHVVMTSDKFLYLFGRFLPAVSMLLCMVLRFVPNLKAKAETIGNARRCIGKSPTDGTKREGLEHGTEILSVLTSWALEGAVVTADSMRSRGYGCGRRSHFSNYRMTLRDWVLLTIMLLCIAGTVLCVALGGTAAAYFPTNADPQAGSCGGRRVYLLRHIFSNTDCDQKFGRKFYGAFEVKNLTFFLSGSG